MKKQGSLCFPDRYPVVWASLALPYKHLSPAAHRPSTGYWPGSGWNKKSALKPVQSFSFLCVHWMNYPVCVSIYSHCGMDWQSDVRPAVMLYSFQSESRFCPLLLGSDLCGFFYCWKSSDVYIAMIASAVINLNQDKMIEWDRWLCSSFPRYTDCWQKKNLSFSHTCLLK